MSVYKITIFLFQALWFSSFATAGALSDREYKDPKGFFEITPPKNWKRQEYPNDPRGKVAFMQPNSVELRVLTNSVDFPDVEGVIQHAKAVEDRLNLDTNIKKTTFNGFPAVERSFVYKGIKFYYVDFVHNLVAHNLAYSAPVKKYEKYLKLAMLSMASYHPISKELSDDERTEHFLSKKRRLGQLLIEQKNYSMAIEYIEEGLAEAPDDEILLDLKKQAQKNISN